jgi:hypothetical protein
MKMLSVGGGRGTGAASQGDDDDRGEIARRGEATAEEKSHEGGGGLARATRGDPEIETRKAARPL